MNTQFKQVTKAYDDGYAHGSSMDLNSRARAPRSLDDTEAVDWEQGCAKAIKDRT